MVSKDPHFSCERICSIDFSFSLEIKSQDKLPNCKLVENISDIFLISKLV